MIDSSTSPYNCHRRGEDDLKKRNPAGLGKTRRHAPAALFRYQSLQLKNRASAWGIYDHVAQRSQGLSLDAVPRPGAAARQGGCMAQRTRQCVQSISAAASFPSEKPQILDGWRRKDCKFYSAVGGSVEAIRLLEGWRVRHVDFTGEVLLQATARGLYKKPRSVPSEITILCSRRTWKHHSGYAAPQVSRNYKSRNLKSG